VRLAAWCVGTACNTSPLVGDGAMPRSSLDVPPYIFNLTRSVPSQVSQASRRSRPWRPASSQRSPRHQLWPSCALTLYFKNSHTHGMLISNRICCRLLLLSHSPGSPLSSGHASGCCAALHAPRRWGVGGVSRLAMYPAGFILYFTDIIRPLAAGRAGTCRHIARSMCLVFCMVYDFAEFHSHTVTKADRLCGGCHVPCKSFVH
jgi:hypothetical protein